MKQAKAHLCLKDKAQWQLAREALAPFCEPVFFSVSHQLDRRIPVSDDLLITDVFAKTCGPLGGIISAFKKAPKSAWFVLACDMPYFTGESAKLLVSKRNTHKLASLYENQDGQPEPLCGIYEPAVFNILLDHWGRGIYCPRRILAPLNIALLKPESEQMLANINHAQEWEQLKTSSAIAITVHYYASLREASGCSEETMTTSAKTIAELYEQLAYRYKFRPLASQLRFAQNDRLVEAESFINARDKIVLIPPVSGG